jgi:metal-dependent amidase/aminoacylase/carboxypeptidase family protein
VSDARSGPAPTAARIPEALRSRLIELRRTLHANPELSNEEHQTAERLTAALDAIGVRDVQRVARTGLVARIPGRNRKAPVVAIRGDIDALPITEATGLPYASTIPGVMHACGHDVHATWGSVPLRSCCTSRPKATSSCCCSRRRRWAMERWR